MVEWFKNGKSEVSQVFLLLPIFGYDYDNPCIVCNYFENAVSFHIVHKKVSFHSQATS